MELAGTHSWVGGATPSLRQQGGWLKPKRHPPTHPPTNQQGLPHYIVIVTSDHTMNGQSSPVPYAKKNTGVTK